MRISMLFFFLSSFLLKQHVFESFFFCGLVWYFFLRFFYIMFVLLVSCGFSGFSFCFPNDFAWFGGFAFLELFFFCFFSPRYFQGFSCFVARVLGLFGFLSPVLHMFFLFKGLTKIRLLEVICIV